MTTQASPVEAELSCLTSALRGRFNKSLAIGVALAGCILALGIYLTSNVESCRSVGCAHIGVSTSAVLVLLFFALQQVKGCPAPANKAERRVTEVEEALMRTSVASRKASALNEDSRLAEAICKWSYEERLAAIKSALKTPQTRHIDERCLKVLGRAFIYSCCSHPPYSLMQSNLSDEQIAEEMTLFFQKCSREVMESIVQDLWHPSSQSVAEQELNHHIAEFCFFWSEKTGSTPLSEVISQHPSYIELVSQRAQAASIEELCGLSLEERLARLRACSGDEATRENEENFLKVVGRAHIYNLTGQETPYLMEYSEEEAAVEQEFRLYYSKCSPELIGSLIRELWYLDPKNKAERGVNVAILRFCFAFRWPSIETFLERLGEADPLHQAITRHPQYAGILAERID